jgi:hypothetical protein
VGKINPDTDAKLTKALDVIGCSSVPTSRTDTDYQIAYVPDKSSALKVTTTFRAVTGFAGTARISPIVAKTSSTLYSQVTDKEKEEYEAAREKYEKAREEFLQANKKYKQAQNDYENTLRVWTDNGDYLLISNPENYIQPDDSSMVIIIGDDDSKYYAAIRGQTIAKLDSAGLSELYGWKVVGNDHTGTVMLKVIQDDTDATELVELYLKSRKDGATKLSESGLIELEVDTRGKTSEEIKKELNEKLQSLGIDDTNVHVMKLKGRTVILLSNDEIKVK